MCYLYIVPYKQGSRPKIGTNLANKSSQWQGRRYSVKTRPSIRNKVTWLIYHAISF